MRGLFQSETDISYQKFIRKRNRGLLQSLSGIKKCNRYYKVWQTAVITKCVRYYKVWQGCYYKVRQVLQSVIIIINKDLIPFL